MAQIVFRDEEVEIEGGLRVGELLRKIGASRSATVVIVNGKPVDESYRIKESDKIRIFTSCKGVRIGLQSLRVKARSKNSCG